MLRSYRRSISAVDLLLIFFVLMAFAGFTPLHGQTAVSAFAPKRNAVAVPPDTVITVTFNGPVLESSFNDSTSFIVAGSVSGRHRGVVSFNGGSSVTFTPSTPFLRGERVTVRVSSALKDASNGTVTPSVWSFTTGAIASPGSYTAAGDYASGSTTNYGTVADLNNDGAPDIVATNGYPTNSISVLLNNGDGTFAAAVAYATRRAPAHVAAGDVDGDGDADLVIADNFDNTFSVMLNDGSGAFGSPVPYNVQESPFGIVLSDLDGDGDLDVAVTNNNNGYVTISLNNGNGTFAAATAIALANCTYITAGDVDNDGDQDLIVTQNQASPLIALLKNNGNGTFAAPVTTVAGSVPEAVDLADIDGDGDLDLLGVSKGNNSVAVWKNDGTGAFSGVILYGAGNGTNGGFFLDANGDRWPDLATVNVTDHSVTVRTHDSNVFYYRTDYNAGTGSQWGAAADLDRDGIVDIVTMNLVANTVSVLKGNGRPHAVLAPAQNITDSGASLSGFVNANASSSTVRFLYGKNPGEYTDSVSASPSQATGVTRTSVTGSLTGLDYRTGYYAVISAVNANGYSRSNEIMFTTAGLAPAVTTVAADGINGSGALLHGTVNANAETTAVRFVYGTSSNSYTDSIAAFPSVVDTSVTVPVAVRLSGLPSLTTVYYRVAALSGSGYVRGTELNFTTKLGVTSAAPKPMAQNVPADTVIAVTFGAAMSTGSINDSTFIVEGSVSGRYHGTFTFSNGNMTVTFDPLRDLVPGEEISVMITNRIRSATLTACLPMSYTFTVAAPKTPGVLGARFDTLITGKPFGATWGDLNNDGYPEAVVAVPNANQLLLFPNDSGRIGPFTVIPSATYQRTVEVTDIDLDGDADLISAGFNSISIFKNNGDGTFAPRTDINTFSNIRTLSAGDLNGDGYGDFALANYYTSIGVVLSNGSGGYAPMVAYNFSGKTFNSATIADIDGDGDGDILAAGDSVYILRNTGNGQFEMAGSIDVNGSPYHITTGDIDHDGDADIIVADIGGFAITLLNNGDGTFAAPQKIYAGGYTSCVQVKDMDGDGDLDLVMENYTSDDIAVLYNDGTGAFPVKKNSATGGGGFYLAVADMDRDGDMDVIATSDKNSLVTILKGASGPPAVSGTTSEPSVNSAVLKGFVDAKAQSTVVRFLYGTVSGTYTDSVQADQSPVVLEANNPVSKTITGLTVPTTYFFRIAASNGSGYVRGEEQSFTTHLAALVVTPASVILDAAGIFDTVLVPITLKNPSATPIAITKFSYMRNLFKYLGPPITTIPANDSVIVPLTFAPQSSGLYIDSFTVTTNSGIGKVFLKSLVPDPALAVAAPLVSFGDVRNDTVAHRSVGIYSSTVSGARIDSVVIHSPFFRPDSVTEARVVRHGDTLRIGVTFLPKPGVPTYLDTIYIYGASVKTPLKVALTGTSLPPQLLLPSLVFSFGDVKIGTTAFQPVGAVSPSVNPARIDSVVFHEKAFGLTGVLLPVTVKQGDTLKFALTFTPTAVRQYVDTVLIFTNVDVKPVPMIVAGASSPVQIAVAAPLLDLGHAKKGLTVTKPFYIVTTSLNSARIDSARFLGKAFGLTGITFPKTILSGDTAKFTVSFTPDSIRSYTDTLLLFNNSVLPVMKIVLTGIGDPLTGVEEVTDVPRVFTLAQNFPNPFNPSTTIRFSLEKAGMTDLRVYDVVGREVALLVHAVRDAGVQYSVTFQADRLPSGIYFARLQSGEKMMLRKMLLVK